MNIQKRFRKIVVRSPNATNQRLVNYHCPPYNARTTNESYPCSRKWSTSSPMRPYAVGLPCLRAVEDESNASIGKGRWK